jgi:hypothetical protein
MVEIRDEVSPAADLDFLRDLQLRFEDDALSLLWNGYENTKNAGAQQLGGCNCIIEFYCVCICLLHFLSRGVILLCFKKQRYCI